MMKQDVLVSIRGLQFSGDTDDPLLETITSGQYQQKNGNHYLIYEEIMEGTTDKVKNILKFSKDRLHMSKSGCVNVTMDFEKGRKSYSTYHTPFGDLMLGIETTEIRLQEQEDSITCHIAYGLDVNYEFLSDCEITIKATNKENGLKLM